MLYSSPFALHAVACLHYLLFDHLQDAFPFFSLFTFHLGKSCTISINTILSFLAAYSRNQFSRAVYLSSSVIGGSLVTLVILSRPGTLAFISRLLFHCLILFWR